MTQKYLGGGRFYFLQRASVGFSTYTEPLPFKIRGHIVMTLTGCVILLINLYFAPLPPFNHNYMILLY